MHWHLVRLIVVLGALLLPGAAGAQTARATITFDNQSGDLALVKLIGPSGRRAEVPTGQKRTVKVVGGQYHIVTRYGTSPDSYRYSKGDPFTVTQTATQHSVITITLHKVVDGNYSTRPVSAEEFNRASP